MKYYITKLFGMLFLLATINAGTLHAQTSLQGESFGDWVVSCQSHDDGVKQCQMSQIAMLESAAEPLLRIDLNFQQPFAEGELVMITPLGISVQKKLRLHFDGKAIKDVYVGFCLSDGCYVKNKLSAALLEQFLHMTIGELKVESGAGQPVSLPISGNGSRAAFNSTR